MREIARTTGSVPWQLAERPLLMDENVEYFSFFQRLSNQRTVSDNGRVGPIPVTEIASFASANEITDVGELLERIQIADAAYVKELNERLERRLQKQKDEARSRRRTSRGR